MKNKEHDIIVIMFIFRESYSIEILLIDFENVLQIFITFF